MTANYNPYIVSDYAPTSTMGGRPTSDPLGEYNQNVGYPNIGYLQYMLQMRGRESLPLQFEAPEFTPDFMQEDYKPPSNLQDYPNVGGIEDLINYIMAKK